MSTREPLVVRAAAVAFAQAVLTTVVLMGWWDISAEQTAAWMGVIALGGTLAVVLASRGKVTPVDDPKDAEGLPLYSLVDVEDLDY